MIYYIWYNIIYIYIYIYIYISYPFVWRNLYVDLDRQIDINIY